MDSQFTSKPLGNLSIFATGREECAPGHHFSHVFRDRFLLHYIVSGKGIFRTGGREYTLGKGNIFFIGDNFGYYEADMEEPWTYIWINFSGETAEQFLERVGLGEKSPVYKTLAPDEVESCFEDILKIDEEENDFLVYSRLFYLLGTIQRTNAAGDEYISGTGKQYVSQCLDFIHINYYRDIDTRDMCAFVGLEYSYLFRLFKEHTNSSPGKYLAEYRLSRAAYLLKNTDMNITETANAVGYKDRAAFSKAFSRCFGISPKQYRAAQGK